MPCPYCQGDAIQELERVTALGYQPYRCRSYRRTFNERTGTPFNHLQVPADIALLVVLWRLRYKLSLRDFAEMFLTRGFTFTHESVREWEERFAPLLTEQWIKEGGYAALEHCASRAPKRPPRVAPVIEQRVLALHQDHPAWGKQRLADELAKASGWVPLASPNTVKRILRDAGLWPEPAPAEKRGDPAG